MVRRTTRPGSANRFVAPGSLSEGSRIHRRLTSRAQPATSSGAFAILRMTILGSAHKQASSRFFALRSIKRVVFRLVFHAVQQSPSSPSSVAATSSPSSSARFPRIRVSKPLVQRLLRNCVTSFLDSHMRDSRQTGMRLFQAPASSLIFSLRRIGIVAALQPYRPVRKSIGQRCCVAV